ncbi:GNAT family N-acetyltransferase [Burkholderia sp. IDO3]|uniref:GNAT family N-acetyltransferase n=1 Tax=Burkholderia sp. IDO3 TaxID=1705310 RepID=UPI000BBB3284|nr:GNAT family N-acetyltransferase [Burkholderia sp. IDO3]AXK62487.1 N-acetyltransferase [Burkholderia sp. IDO3]PCD63562.1 GNAT family N-acetyltransferase [Burkholderia sp. IDO3]
MRFPPLTPFETEWLILRPLVPDDAAALFEQMLGDAETMKYLPILRHGDLAQTHAYIAEARRGWRDGTLIRYACECRATGQLAAVIELTPDLPCVRLSVMIAKRGGTRRRRACLMALQELLGWLLAQRGVQRIYAHCVTGGPAGDCIERLGFRCEALLKRHEPQPNRELPMADCHLYVLTRYASPSAPAPDAGTWLRELLRDSTGGNAWL